MPLPPYPEDRPVWIEVTKSEHEHGGDGWEFGTCLWSPSSSKPTVGQVGGQDIYKAMRRVRTGDLVLHIYRNTWEGTARSEFRLCAYSYAAAPFRELTTEPPKAGEWSDRPSYYRVDVEGFTELEDSLIVPAFLRAHGKGIFAEKSAGVPTGYPFAIYRGELRLSQGNYLAVCTPTLYELFRHALGETDRVGQVRPSQRQQEEFAEGTRRKREAYFFARNPALVREAKQHYGYRCMACDFDFEATYGAIGQEFIECHHLNPLSERAGSERVRRLTRLDEVAVLCSNCHRMVHKRRPPVPVEELRAMVAAQTGRS